jgi:hypothetical protein
MTQIRTLERMAKNIIALDNDSRNFIYNILEKELHLKIDNVR